MYRIHRLKPITTGHYLKEENSGHEIIWFRSRVESNPEVDDMDVENRRDVLLAAPVQLCCSVPAHDDQFHVFGIPGIWKYRFNRM